MKKILANWSNWKFIIPALLGMVYCIYLFQVNEAKLVELAKSNPVAVDLGGKKIQLIDMRRDYDAEEIITFFKAIQTEGRQIHQWTTGVLDMIFPFAYGLLFILIAAFFLKKIVGPDSNWMYLSLFPVFLMIVDYMENFNTLDMLKNYPNLSEEMVVGASKITGIKSMFTDISMVLPLVLAIIWVVKRIRVR